MTGQRSNQLNYVPNALLKLTGRDSLTSAIFVDGPQPNRGTVIVRL